MKQFLVEAQKYRKAIVGAVVAFIFSYLVSSSNGVTTDEWLFILTNTLSAGGLVWAVPNKKAKPDEKIE